MGVVRIVPVDVHLAVVPVDIRHVAIVIARTRRLPAFLIFTAGLFQVRLGWPILYRNFLGSITYWRIFSKSGQVVLDCGKSLFGLKTEPIVLAYFIILQK